MLKLELTWANGSIWCRYKNILKTLCDCRVLRSSRHQDSVEFDFIPVFTCLAGGCRGKRDVKLWTERQLSGVLRLLPRPAGQSAVDTAADLLLQRWEVQLLQQPEPELQQQRECERAWTSGPAGPVSVLNACTGPVLLVSGVVCVLCSSQMFRTSSTVLDSTCTTYTPPVQVEFARESGERELSPADEAGVVVPDTGNCLVFSVERAQLVIRDLGNTFIHHPWTLLWNQVSGDGLMSHHSSTEVATDQLFLCRSWKVWRLCMCRPVWIPPAPTPPPPPCIWTTPTSRVPCTSVLKLWTGSFAGKSRLCCLTCPPTSHLRLCRLVLQRLREPELRPPLHDRQGPVPEAAVCSGQWTHHHTTNQWETSSRCFWRVSSVSLHHVGKNWNHSAVNPKMGKWVGWVGLEASLVQFLQVSSFSVC